MASEARRASIVIGTQDTGFTDLEVVARSPLPPKELAEMACCPGSEFTPSPATEDIASVEGKVVSIRFWARALSH